MTFPGVKALDHVDFTLRKGEIMALMGENGAGKSTLIKCLTGVNKFEAGEIHLEGISGAIVNKDTLDAQKKGISTVYQEVNLCPNLSVAENLFIGREPMTKFHTVDRRAMNKRAEELMKSLNLPVDVRRKLEDYSIALQEMVAIARAVDMDSKVLILDEPTSSLDDQEVEKLFTMMRALKKKGVGIIFVTHFLEQVYRSAIPSRFSEMDAWSVPIRWRSCRGCALLRLCLEKTSMIWPPSRRTAPRTSRRLRFISRQKD